MGRRRQASGGTWPAWPSLRSSSPGPVQTKISLTGALSSDHLPAVGLWRRAGHCFENRVREEPVTAHAVPRALSAGGLAFSPLPGSRDALGERPAPRQEERTGAPGAPVRHTVLSRAVQPSSVFWSLDINLAIFSRPQRKPGKDRTLSRAHWPQGQEENSAQHPISPAAQSSQDGYGSNQRRPSMPALCGVTARDDLSLFLPSSTVAPFGMAAFLAVARLSAPHPNTLSACPFLHSGINRKLPSVRPHSGLVCALQNSSHEPWGWLD